MAEVTMPRLSDTMSEGAVGKWLKQPGDQVATGDIIAEIETDKATMELESFESGTLQKILVPEGQTVVIGTPIAIIGDGAAEAAPAAKSEAGAPSSAAEQAPTEEGGAQAVARTMAEAQAEPPAAQAQVQPPAQAAAPSADGERIKASPVARRLADERGIDLRQVKGTGPGGRIIKENVEDFKPEAAKAPAAAPAAQPAAAPAAPQAPAPSAEAVPMSRMRRAIARAMTDSQPGTPHIYVTAEIDMAAAVALRKQINDSGAAEVKVSINDLVVKAAAKALRKFPTLNSSYATSADGQPAVLTHSQINVSVAVALEDGLVAPVVRDTDKKAIGTIAAEIKDMAGRAREGKIKQNELDGGTFQVSNLGMFDVVEFTSIIPAPLAASLSVGAVRQTPVVQDGQLAIGERMTVTISVDHRVADGATAAQYLQEVRRLLQAPMSLLV
jgi:pyruvate dehydrogenase E2 component (dihydrolipoamide acetyltransferase)